MGNLVNARPCYLCTLMMKDIHINKVYYSMDGEIICEKVSHMISINCSLLRRRLDNAPTDLRIYYKKIIEKMPKTTKRKNADYFLKGLKHDIVGAQHEYTKNQLRIFIGDFTLGIIMII